MSNPHPVSENGDLDELSRYLQQSSLFCGMDDAERELLMRLMVEEEFAAEEVIIRQETVTRNLWLVLEGTCKVIKHPRIGTYGESVQLADLQPLDVFGEMTLMAVEPHVASVEAKSNVRTLRLRGEDFDTLTKTEPKIACQLACSLIYVLSQRLRSVDEKLSQQLDRHSELTVQQHWRELRERLGKLYAGTPNL